MTSPSPRRRVATLSCAASGGGEISPILPDAVRKPMKIDESGRIIHTALFEEHGLAGSDTEPLHGFIHRMKDLEVFAIGAHAAVLAGDIEGRFGGRHDGP